MTKGTAPSPTALETLLEWSQTRPAWQRDALRRIVSKGRLDDADIEELTVLCKQGRGAKTPGPKAVLLAKAHLPANPGESGEVSLLSIADADGVNNLAPAQTLSFAQKGLTIVYGDNGAGKSGYARILKRACRARHPGTIEPNIYSAQSAPPTASATIVYAIGGVPQAPEKWQDSDNPHPTLSAVSVFDSDCALVHIREKNEVAFRPFGLDVPDELAAACQAVKNALNAEQQLLQKARNPVLLKPPWKESTAVGKVLSALKHDTDVAAIEALATLTDYETARLARLREDLSKDPGKASAEQRLRADNIKHLLSEINRMAEKTCDTALAAIATAARDAAVKREAARIAADDAFSREPLGDVGSSVWRTLWESARRYSQDVAYPGVAFPASHPDARCVLCHQTLSAEAKDRMMRFEDFIRKDTERLAQEAEQSARALRDALASFQIATRAVKAHLQAVALENPEIAREIRKFIAAARLRRYVLFGNIESAQDDVLPAIPRNPSTDLAALEEMLRAHSADLQNVATGEQRKNLEAEYAELRDRALLAGMMDTVREEVERLKVIQFLETCTDDTPTNAITKIGNDIADTVVTPRLRDRFQQEIVKLAADKVRVEIVRSGGKYGSPQYQVRLFANPDARVQDILSEGEKTCVALAAFLTELATATHKSAIVFDDPVSSLDHRWRKQVAKRLVEEAEQRQIIVFTHDLIFVNDLDDLADEKKLSVQLVTVKRGQPGAGLVEPGLPWKGKNVEDRIDRLEKAARAAKPLYDNNEEDEYAREAVTIYNNLRASWERTLEDIVFFRVVQRHRDYIDTKNLKKVTVLTEADCDVFQAGFNKCSDVIDAHDPSSARNALVPPPDEIMQDIQALKAWVGTLRERQKKVA